MIDVWGINTPPNNAYNTRQCLFYFGLSQIRVPNSAQGRGISNASTMEILLLRQAIDETYLHMTVQHWGLRLGT